MKTREATLLASESQSAAGTKIVPIRVTDPISRLLIPFSVTVGAAARLSHPSDVFSKIEIVDGSDVLFSLSGTQIDGMAMLEGKREPVNFLSNKESITDSGNLIIDFGRWLYDTELAFDPTKFSNPQIRLTHNFATVEANATAVAIAIHALLMEDMAGKVPAFLMKKEIKSWTAADNEWEYTTMPLDYIYRRIYLQCLTHTIGVGAHVDRVKLSEDNDKRIPFDVEIDDQIARNAMDYGQVIERVAGLTYASGHPFFASPAYSGQLAVMNDTSQAVATFQVVIFDGGQYEVRGDGSDTYRGVVSGFCPQGLVMWQMGTPNEIANWYDPTKLGNLRLEAYGAGSNTVHLLTEQMRKYA